jgi:hypothetical protein
LNGRKIEESYESYEIGLPPTTMVKTLGGYKPLYKIKLGDKITEHDTVVGIQLSETDEFCILPNYQRVAKGNLIWNKEKSQWLRAHTMYPSTESANCEVIALFVSPGAKYEIVGGHVIRDAMEVYSPDTKKLYAEALLNK